MLNIPIFMFCAVFVLSCVVSMCVCLWRCLIIISELLRARMCFADYSGTGESPATPSEALMGE
jgi:hypothetical protein